MYKKAGIVIAIVLVVAGILALSISSCNKDGGIQVKNNNKQTSEVENDGDKDDSEHQENLKLRNNDEDTEKSNEISDEVSELELVSEDTELSKEVSKDKKESNVDNTEDDSNVDSSTELEAESSLSEEDKAALEELKKYKEEQNSKENSDTSKEESSKQESKIDTEDDTDGLRYKEIKSEDLPSDKKEKNVIGIITGKEILVEGNNVFTTIIILDENSDSYRYFVPKSAYDSLKKGTKLDVSIIVYFDGEKSIKQVTGVSVAE